MGSKKTSADEAICARLLWQMKAIATKEVEALPVSTMDSFFLGEVSSVSSQDSEEESAGRRGRTVSLGSVDMATSSPSAPLVSSASMSFIADNSSLNPSSPDKMEHYDWSKRVFPCILPSSSSFLPEPQVMITQKYGKRKRESFVGLASSTGNVRATLRKKFSWKQYPELEEYLLMNQEEYFEHSSRNYTAEQRKYNNSLTRGLLDLAASEGYVFEGFTFSMVRDRIRCYYKSHSQSAKKKRKR